MRPNELENTAKEHSIVVSCPATKSQNQAPLSREATPDAGSRLGKFVLSREACQHSLGTSDGHMNLSVEGWATPRSYT